MTKELTERQKLFIEAYLRNPNATQAAREAGYKSALSEGHKLKNRLAPYIQEAQGKRAEKAGIDAEWVLKELTEALEVAKGGYRVKLGKSGKPIKDKNGLYILTRSDAAVLKALDLIMKHVSVNALASQNVNMNHSVDDTIEKLRLARLRVNGYDPTDYGYSESDLKRLGREDD